MADLLADVPHGRATLEDVSDGEVHAVVESAVDVVLIVCDIGVVSVEYLSNRVNVGVADVFRPERLLNVGDGIYSDTVKVVGLDQISDPVF